jgi:hypothetical protein
VALVIGLIYPALNLQSDCSQMLTFVVEFSGFAVNAEVSVPSVSQGDEQDDMKPHAETCSKHFLDSTWISILSESGFASLKI